MVAKLVFTMARIFLERAGLSNLLNTELSWFDYVIYNYICADKCN